MLKKVWNILDTLTFFGQLVDNDIYHSHSNRQTNDGDTNRNPIHVVGVIVPCPFKSRLFHRIFGLIGGSISLEERQTISTKFFLYTRFIRKRVLSENA